MSGALEGLRTGLLFMAMYDQILEQEIGKEKAAVVKKTVMDSMAKAQADMIRQRTGMTDFGLEALHSIIPQIMAENCGSVFELIEKTPTKFTYNLGPCAGYEASEMLGMAPAAIKAHCDSSGNYFVNALLQELNPKVHLELHRFRKNADDHCVESFVLSQ